MPEKTAENNPLPGAGRSADGLSWLVQEKLGERRFYALVQAIRTHEADARQGDAELSPHDRELYALLRRTCEEL